MVKAHWLGELDHVIVGHGVSLLHIEEVEGLNTTIGTSAAPQAAA